MQQGIQSLMPQGSQQGPMPGQAPQMPMPGMMPKQGAPTPPAMVGPLTQMHLDQLTQMMLNPRPDGPPLYAVISAITEKQKQAQAQANMQRQMAMAQGQQAAQQPPVAQQVMQAAMQQAPVGAAQGGIMQGYAGGGAVAFQSGGRTYGYAPDYEEARRIGINLSPYDSKEVRQDKLRRLEEYRRTGIVPPPQETEPSEYRELGSSPEEMMGQSVLQRPRSKAIGLATPSLSATAKGIANIISGERPRFYSEELYNSRSGGRGTMTPPMAASEEGQRLAERMNAPTQFALDPNNPQALNALRRAAMTAGGQEREDLLAQIAQMQSQLPRGGYAPEPSTSVTAASQVSPSAQALITGLPALSAERQAQIQADQRTAEKIAQDRQALAQQMGTVSPEVLASRERLQKILSGAYDPQRQALEEAKAERARGLRGNAEALGLIAARASRGRRAGQVLGEAAGAAAEFMGGQRKRVEELTDKYNTLKSQLDITMAQAQHADIVGDDKLKRDALAKAEDIKAELFNTQRAIRQGAVTEQAQQATGIAALQKAQADLASINKPSTTAQLLKDLGLPPTLESVRQLTEAQYGPRTEGRSKITYDQAADNVGKFMDSLAGMQEIAAIKKRAKESGQPEPSMAQIREMLIQRELQGGGGRVEASAPTGQAVPPGVTVKRVGP